MTVHKYKEEMDVLAKDFCECLEERFSLLFRYFARFVLMGILKNGLQSKMQVSFLSLDRFLRSQHGEQPPNILLLLGVILNILGCICSLGEVYEVRKLSGDIGQDAEKVQKIMTDRAVHVNINYGMQIVKYMIQSRIMIFLLFWLGICYALFVLYQVVNLCMVFQCNHYVWNLHFDGLMAGCVAMHYSD